MIKHNTELSEADISKLKYLYMIEAEFREVRNFINTLLGYEPFSLDVRESTETQNALNIAVVISYARSFKRSYNFGNIRDVNEQLKNDFSEEELLLHERIIRDRDKEFAHSDAESNDVQIYDDGYSLRTVRQLLEKQELKLLKLIVNKISVEINKQISIIKPAENLRTNLFDKI